MMKARSKAGITRRNFIRLAAVASPALALAACGEQSATSPVSQAQPTTAAPGPTAAIATTVATGPATAASTTATAPTQAATVAATTPAATTPASTAAPATAATTQAAAVALPPTPACASKASQTLAQTEGPYFKPSSPLRASLLEAGTTGPKLIVTGYVLTTDCRPVKGALLDFWQADAGGQYDNQGYKMRGHQFTDENGLFRLETVVPGLYPGRTRHIHVKVQAPNQPILTTQLYFPGEPRNQTDGIFNPALLMQVNDSAGNSKQGLFNFVLRQV